MTRPNRFAALTESSGAEERAEPLEERAERPLSETVRMLGGRVPDSIFREFNRQKVVAEEELGVRKITTEEGLEALVRLLRNAEFKSQWLQALQEIRKGRRS
ncbi:hypothetical protein FNU79_14175 [Deinococcus detaillensis]|uniref:Uncharacterized protein n=1 Tax=Deinococcus detaillensis TaxID=2592048 RepID=A0A553UPK8_9DEIO|nr:hypothetical protein [Deinococcus detaillensis]TSA82160.1 hypothetical protein FNU79_14175 [Deinococcus detaillensis]